MTSKRPKMTVIDGGGAPPKEGAKDWRDALLRDSKGRVEGSLFNLVTILEHDELLAGLFWLNQFSGRITMARTPPWSGSRLDEFQDADCFELTSWAQNAYGMKVADETIWKAVVAVSRRNGRHPLREYLEGLKWDGTPRAEALFVKHFGVAESAYARGSALCFLVSAVARVLWVDPAAPALGAKVDFMVVLEGGQGKKKSTAVQTLFTAPWYVETMESPSKPDFFQVIQGAWAIEIAEMDSFSKVDVTSIKATITRRTDKFRAPYDRAPKSWRRECVFVGTTNKNDYLRDDTGGRRFLPVAVPNGGAIDVAAIDAQRDQLWAEAVHLFRQGFEYWLLPHGTAEEQDQRYVGDSWEDMIARWLTGRLDPSNYPTRLQTADAIDFVSTNELLQHAIGLDAGRHGTPEQMRIAKAMGRLGWRKRRKEDRFLNIRVSGWEPGDGLAKPDAERLKPAPAGGFDAPPF